MPPYTRRIICLANSKKNLGRCVAGLELTGGNPGTWLRPVSERSGHELSLDDRRYEDGGDVALLDIVDITLLRHAPEGCQHENHVIDDTIYWRKVGTFPASDLVRHARTAGPLWVDGNSSYSGVNDRVAADVADQLRHSLELVRPTKPIIFVAPGRVKRQVRAGFHLGAAEYNLVVTDTKVEAAYLSRENGTYPLPGEVLFCVSLGEPFDGNRYKLVAAVIAVTK
jgi:hypothetical protein